MKRIHKKQIFCAAAALALLLAAGRGFSERNVQNAPLGVLDAEGKALSGFLPTKTYYDAYPWNGYFTALLGDPDTRTKDETEYLHSGSEL